MIIIPNLGRKTRMIQESERNIDNMLMTSLNFAHRLVSLPCTGSMSNAEGLEPRGQTYKLFGVVSLHILDRLTTLILGKKFEPTKTFSNLRFLTKKKQPIKFGEGIRNIEIIPISISRNQKGRPPHVSKQK